MTIPAQCTCGQRFAAKDELAGKRVKCPKCGEVLVIPGPASTGQTATASTSTQPPVSPTASPPPQQPTANPAINSLFDEEEIGVESPLSAAGGHSKPCPNCRKLAPLQAVVCVECGWNFEENRLLKTKRAPKKRQADNPYGYDAYYDQGDDAFTSKRRGGNRDSGDRRGPAWEADDNLVTKYFQTVFEILVTPQFAFRNMRWYGGLGGPIFFVLTGYVISFLIQMLFRLSWFAITGETLTGMPRQLQAEERAAFGIGLLCSMVVGAGCVMVVGAIVLPLPMLISAGIAHLCLLIVGGAKQSYEATFRAHEYVFGAMVLPYGLLGIVPILGFLLGSILQTGYTIVAVKHTHEIQWWQAVLATILWILISTIIIVGIIFLMVLALGDAFRNHPAFQQ